MAREDLALEAAFWAQLPGNFPIRPRKSPITSRNFAAMVPFHNYPAGRPDGNHWGAALAVLVTSAAIALSLFAARERSAKILTAAAARIRVTRLSAVRPARARRCSSGFWWQCFLGRVSRRCSSIRIAVWRSWCGLSAVSTFHSRTAYRPASIRCSYRSTPSNVEFLKIWLPN